MKPKKTQKYIFGDLKTMCYYGEDKTFHFTDNLMEPENDFIYCLSLWYCNWHPRWCCGYVLRSAEDEIVFWGSGQTPDEAIQETRVKVQTGVYHNGPVKKKGGGRHSSPN